MKLAGKMAVMILLGLATAAQGSADWRIEVVDQVGQAGRYGSLALDGWNRPRVAYAEEDGFDLRYARRGHGGWTAEAVDREGEVGRHAALVLEGEDRPHLMYYDRPNRTLRYAWAEGSVWRSEVVDDLGWSGKDSSLRLDSRGELHVSYHQDHPDIYLQYTRGRQGSWVTENVGSGEIFAHGSSLALDGEDLPRISYLTGWSLMVARRGAEGWNLEEAFAGMQRGESTALCLDAQDREHIIHAGVDLEGPQPVYHVLYTTRSPTGWSTETLDSFTFDGQVQEGWRMDAELEGGETLHAAYFHAGEGELRYARKGPGGWEIQTVDSDGEVGQFCSLALDEGGGVHLAYHDVARGDLRYAANEAPWPPPDLGVRLDLPGTVRGGNGFWTQGLLDNPGPARPEVLVFFVLEIQGALWFWDDWTPYDPVAGTGVDSSSMALPTGTTEVQVIPWLPWPEGVGAGLEGLALYGAMLDPSTGDLLGGLAVEPWSIETGSLGTGDAAGGPGILAPWKPNM